MNKPPAFQFYANDWLGSTQVMLMSPAEEGAYIRLLAIAWNDEDCCLPNDDDKLAKLSRLGEAWHNGSGAIIKKCFKEKGNKIFNERLLKEKRKIKQFRKERSESGKIGAEKRWHSKGKRKNKKDNSPNSLANGSAITQPMAKNSSSSSFSSSNKNGVELQENSTQSQLEIEKERQKLIDIELSKLLMSLIIEDLPDYKELKKQEAYEYVKWGKYIRLMREQDNRNPEEIREMILWCHKESNFWNSVIMSTRNLRENFDQIKKQMKKKIKQEEKLPGRDYSDMPLEEMRTSLEGS